jgi:hypothetical protein
MVGILEMRKIKIMKDNNIIKKLTISIGGKDVDVTPKQAKDLYEALGELIGAQKVVTEYVPYRQQWVWPYTPSITWLTGTGDLTTVGTGSTLTNMTYEATSNTAYLSV